MATSNIEKSMEIKTATVSGSSGSQGAMSLASVVSADDLVLSVACTNYTNALCIPWKYKNTTWFVKVVEWQSLVSVNTTVSLIVVYIPNGLA